MLKFVSDSTTETEALGERIAAVLKGDEVIALFGDLGAGKTAFTRGLCRGLGIIQGVSSPTFAIVNEYRSAFPIYHFDMYRISGVDDLYSTGYFDYIGNGLLVIEWSENIVEELENDAIRITISKTDDENRRLITIDGMDAYADTIC